MNAPTEDDLRAFVGPRADAYWRRWRWYIARNRRMAGTLWPPFFFNAIWFLYRRMYRELWVPVAIIIATSIVQALLEVMFLGNGRGAAGASVDLDRVTNFAAAVATSYAGSALYLRRLRRAVAEAGALGLEGDERRVLIQSRGGTNPIAASVAALVAAGLILLSLGAVR